MGRDATKATGNPWYEARKRAAEFDERLYSREGAAERLGMSVSSVADAELGLTKCMPVEKAVLMADLYKAPELLNHYCLHECPIGCRQPISDEVLDVDRITVKILRNLSLDRLKEIRQKMLDISYDGIVSEDEKPDLQEVVEYLEETSRSISELKILADKLLNGGE